MPLIAGAIAGVVPFVMSSATANVSWVNGEVASVTYRDWTALGCGAGAILCGLAAIAMFASAKRAPLVIAGVAIAALGGYQVARGMGMFYKPEKPPEMARPREPLPPRAKDPATCPDQNTCDNLAADLDKTDAKAARIARARSCGFGADYACEELAEAWLKEDPAKARDFYEKACTLKRGSACNELAVVYLNGDGVDKDLAKGKAYLDKACEYRQALGCKNLAIVYRDALGVPADLAKAYEYAKRSCDIDQWMTADGDAVAYACNYQGNALVNGTGVKVDKAAALEAYGRACDRSKKYCFNLGAALQQGLVTKDLPRARELFEVSCEAGSSDACNNLGDMTNRGQGGPKDKAKARELFEKACDDGNELGCKNLKGMK